MRLPFASSFLAAAFLFSAPACAQMTDLEVIQVIEQAASVAARISPASVIAVTDREGFILGVWGVSSNPAPADVANAIAKAGTAAYLSSDQHAFSSRTAGFIVQQNFPPDVRNRPPGPLVGVNFSNLAFSDVNRFKNPPFTIGIDGIPIGDAPPLPPTGGLAGTPGGVPLYRMGRLIGGVGVAGDGDGPVPQVEQRFDVDEAIALAGQNGFEPHRTILGTRILIDGIRLPYVETRAPWFLIDRARSRGTTVTGYPILSSPDVQYPRAVMGGAAGEIRQPIIADPIAGDINGQPRLTADEVTGILARGAQRARATRAGIRLPAGQPVKIFITVVNNPAQPGTAPTVLGTFRMTDTTLFSWDVAVQKARSAVYFSSERVALSTRSIGFLSQKHYPPGIEDTAPGLFLGLQERFSMFPLPVNPLNGAEAPQPPAMDPELPNGITIFPGGFPLYRNGVLIGAVGVSGDGVDQDDLVAVSGSEGFFAPEGIRADRFQIRGARLPFAKFPRNPGLE